MANSIPKSDASHTPWLNRLPVWGLLLITLLIRLVLGFLSNRLVINPGFVTAIWLANAVIIAMLARVDRRRWHWVVLGQMAGCAISHLGGPTPISAVFCYLIGEVAEILLAAVIITRAGTERVDFGSQQQVLRLFVAAGPGNAVTGAIVAAASTWVVGGTHPLDVWALWTSADGLGILILVPALLSFGRRNESHIWTAGIVETVCLFSGLYLLSFGLFCHHIPMGIYLSNHPLLLTLPFLLWTPLRTNVFGMSMAAVLLAGFAVGGTLRGLGPYVASEPTPQGVTAVMQFTLMVWTACGLIIAVVTQTIRRTTLETARERERFKRLTETIGEVFWMADGGSDNPRYVSPAYEKVWGRSCQSLLDDPDSFLQAIHPEDRPHVMIGLESQKKRQPFSHEYRVIRPDGSIRWVLDRGFPVTNEDGRFTHYAGVAQDITQQKEFQFALFEANEFNNQVIRSVQDGIIVFDRDFRYRIWSPAMEQISGLAAVDVLGKTPMQLFPFLKEVGVLAMLERAMEGETISSPDFPYEVPESGRKGWSWQLMGPLRSTDGTIIGVITTVREITDRKRDEELLRQSYDRFQVLSSATFEGIVIHQNGIIVDCNEQFARIIGYDRSELTGMDVRRFVAPEAQDIVMAGILSGRDSNMEHAAVCKDGTRIILEARGRIASYAGKPVRITAVRDITHRAQMQEMATQSAKMLSLGGLAAGMAHEINNPLAIMVQNAEVAWQRISSTDSAQNHEAAKRAGTSVQAIQRYMHDREIGPMLQAIHSSGERAAAIVKNMLTFSRPRSGGKSLHQLQELADQAILLLQSDLELKQLKGRDPIEVIKEYDNSLPGVVCIPSEIQQVLMNLLKNAVHACAANSSVVARIILKLMRESDHAVVVVEDNGIGMSESVRQRVFEPFFTTKPPGEGTGLGLFISYFIITQHHGGMMRVKPSPDGGSSFEILLPLANVQTASLKPDAIAINGR